MIKDFLKKVWEKIKQYKAIIIMYIITIPVGIVSDILFGSFNIIKYIVYAILLIAIIIVMIIYKDKIKNSLYEIEAYDPYDNITIKETDESIDKLSIKK